MSYIVLFGTYSAYERFFVQRRCQPTMSFIFWLENVHNMYLGDDVEVWGVGLLFYPVLRNNIVFSMVYENNNNIEKFLIFHFIVFKKSFRNGSTVRTFSEFSGFVYDNLRTITREMTSPHRMTESGTISILHNTSTSTKLIIIIIRCWKSIESIGLHGSKWSLINNNYSRLLAGKPLLLSNRRQSEKCHFV